MPIRNCLRVSGVTSQLAEKLSALSGFEKARIHPCRQDVK